MRSKILKDTIALNLSSVARQLFTVAQSFLLMRFLAPDALGVWLELGILLSYAAYAHFGIEFGMGLRLLFYRGRGDEERERECEDSAFFAWTLLALMLSLILAVVALQGRFSTNMRLGLLAVALMVPAEQQAAFFGRWQASSKIDFYMGSYIAVARGVMSFVLVVCLSYFYGLVGLLVGSVLVSIATAAAWWWQSSYRYKRRVTSDMLAELFRVGVPLLATSACGMLLQTVDRMVIASRLGAASLGYYGATGLGGGLLLGVLYQAGSALTPHIVLETGKHQANPEQLAKFLVKPTVVASYLACVSIMMLLFVIPAVIEVALPRYVPGIPAVYGFMPGFFFLAIVLTASNVLALVLIEKGRYSILSMVLLQAAAVALEICLAVLFIRFGWDIGGVAIASTMSYALYGGGILLMASTAVFADRRRRVVFLGQVITPFVVCSGVVVLGVLVGQQLPAIPALRAGVGVALGCVALVPLTLWLDRQVPLVAELRGLLTAVRSRFTHKSDGT